MVPGCAYLISDFRHREFTDFDAYDEHWGGYKTTQLYVSGAGLIALWFLKDPISIGAIGAILMFYELYMLKWGHNLRVSYF